MNNKMERLVSQFEKDGPEQLHFLLLSNTQDELITNSVISSNFALEFRTKQYETLVDEFQQKLSKVKYIKFYEKIFMSKIFELYKFLFAIRLYKFAKFNYTESDHDNNIKRFKSYSNAFDIANKMYKENDPDIIIKNIKKCGIGSEFIVPTLTQKLDELYPNYFLNSFLGEYSYKFYFNYVYDLIMQKFELYRILVSLKKFENSQKKIYNSTSELLLEFSKSDISLFELEAPKQLQTIIQPQYYSHKYDASIIKPLRDLHNNIKKSLITDIVKRLRYNKQKYISLLDMAGGQGGDLFKWEKNNINEVLFIEFDKMNLENPKDGAIKRFSEMKTSKMKITFVHGDSSKLYINGNAGMDEQNKNILLKFYETHSKHFFNIVSCQFAIHYFFRNKTDLEIFLDNVSDNLQKDGYFIGTALDGKEIYEKLKTRKNISGYIGEQLIWDIQKKYDDDNFLNYGQKISVFNLNIGQYIDEYLVNFEYLKTLSAQKRLKFISFTNFNFWCTTLKATNLSPDEKTYSFMHKSFIFQKF